MILIYLVAPGDTNEPLRYSLRSVHEHVKPDRVILAGHKPTWANTDHFPHPQERRHWSNQVDILKTVVTHPDCPEQFTVMNDDFFATRPITTVHLTRHPDPTRLRDLAQLPGWTTGWYRQSLTATIKRLNDLRIPPSEQYAFDRLHTPLPVHRDLLAETLHEGTQHRSLYGNIAMREGHTVWDGYDAKTRRADHAPDTTWVSINQASWGGVLGTTLRTRHPHSSPYER